MRVWGAVSCGKGRGGRGCLFGTVVRVYALPESQCKVTAFRAYLTIILESLVFFFFVNRVPRLFSESVTRVGRWPQKHRPSAWIKRIERIIRVIR